MNKKEVKLALIALAMTVIDSHQSFILMKKFDQARNTLNSGSLALKVIANELGITEQELRETLNDIYPENKDLRDKFNLFRG